MSNDKNVKGIKDTLYERFKDFIVNELVPKRTATDIVSSNAKIVLYGLFALIGFAILTYAIVVTGDKYNPDSESYKNLNDTQRVERGESLDQLNVVYVAAISGAVALGGTLISQLWGRGFYQGLSDKEQLSGEKVSYNSKAVLLGLFALVGFVLLVFTISANIFSPDQTGRLTTVFVAAISGTLALGGTLITQLWGKDTGNRPNIYRTDPEDTATGVPVGTPIRATFNKLMNSSTINSQTFTLKDDTNFDLEGTVTLEGGNAIFKPSTSNPLKPLTKYTVTITKDVKDITGNSLEDDKVWSFTTGNGDATPAPSNNSPKVKDQKTS